MQNLKIGHWVPATRAEGPHQRAALWVSGCSIRCPGCCNPELFSREAGRERSLAQLKTDTRMAQREAGIEGVSVLGGEPLEQWMALVPWLAWLRTQGFGVIVFTGFRWPWIAKQPIYTELPELVDTLVDGPFVKTLPEEEGGRAVVGSSNQQLRHFSDRYQDPELWKGRRRAQVQIQRDGRVQIHGAPLLVAKIKAKLQPAYSCDAEVVESF